MKIAYRWFLALTVVLAIGATPLRAEEPAASAGAESIEKMIADLRKIAELIKQLDETSFQKRQQATDQLKRMGRLAIEPLQRVLESKPSLEMSTRVTGILRDLRKEQRKSTKLHALLAQPVNLDKGIDVNTPLKDALEFLSDRYDVTFVVDYAAFEAIGVQKVEEQPVQLPKMVGISLRVVLDRLVGQIKGDIFRGSYLVRGDHIEVTTTRSSNPRNWTEDAREAVPTVNVEFEREPLEEALRHLVDSTGISVLVDERVGIKAQKTVTAALRNVPFDTAVQLLADLADLKPVVMDNVLYVTSKDNAKQLEAQQRKRLAAMPAKPAKSDAEAEKK
ncbi:MAG: hypothetical protein K2R98_25090 [Gemmataceae bacterium]|nr:hypothetical protein [Gemmataceae bacterium]